MKIKLPTALLLPLLPCFAGGAKLACGDGVTAYSYSERCDGNNFTLILRSCTVETVETYPCLGYADIATFQYCHTCGDGPVCSDNNDTEAVCSDVDSDTCDSVNYEAAALSCVSSTEGLDSYRVCNNGTKEVFDGPERKQSCVEFF